MENPRTLSYEKLLSIYLEDRRLKRKNTSTQQRQDLELMSRREITTAGRFYIKKRSYDYAITWLQRAGNYPQALYVLGALYLKQPHLAPDNNEKARMYFMQSRTSIACHNLGNMYNNGLGVPRDKQEALKWFVQGGLQGLRRSKYEAGLIYFQDAHRSRESAKLAYYWLKSALKTRKKTRNNVVAKKLEELVDMLDYDIEALARNYNPYRDRREVHTIQDNHEDDSDNSYDEEGSGDEDSGDEMSTQPESSDMAASESNSNMAQPQSSFISASNSPPLSMAAANNMARPESSFMALSRDAIQVQSSFIPLSNNVFQPESSSMAAFNNTSLCMAAANDTIQPQPPSSNMPQPEPSIMTRSKSKNNNMTQPDQSARVKQLQNRNKVYKRTITRLEDKIYQSRRIRNDYINNLERKNEGLMKKIKDMENLFYWIAQNEANNY